MTLQNKKYPPYRFVRFWIFVLVLKSYDADELDTCRLSIIRVFEAAYNRGLISRDLYESEMKFYGWLN